MVNATAVLPPDKTWWPLYWRLGGPQNRCGQVNVTWGDTYIYQCLRNSICECITYLRSLQFLVNMYHVASATFPWYLGPVLPTAKGESSNQLFFFIYLPASLSECKTTWWSHLGYRKLKLLSIRNPTVLKLKVKLSAPLASVRGNTPPGNQTPISSSPSVHPRKLG